MPGAPLHFTRFDQDLVAGRHGAANRLGFAVQLALLRHPGLGLAQINGPVEALVNWLAEQLEIPASAFAQYARRPQTMTDHARILAAALGLRPSVKADLPLMIEAAAQSAWGTDSGYTIVAGVIEALRVRKILLPAPAVIERVAIAGRARKRAADGLLADVSAQQIMQLEQLLVMDAGLGMTLFAWLKDIPISPKADHIRELIDRLRSVRKIDLSPEVRRAFTRTGFSNSFAKGIFPMLAGSSAMPRTGGAPFWSQQSSISKHASLTLCSACRTS